MPRQLWEQLVNGMVAAMLLGTAATLWQVNATLAVHGEKLQTIEKRMDRWGA